MTVDLPRLAPKRPMREEEQGSLLLFLIRIFGSDRLSLSNNPLVLQTRASAQKGSTHGYRPLGMS